MRSFGQVGFVSWLQTLLCDSIALLQAAAASLAAPDAACIVCSFYTLCPQIEDLSPLLPLLQQQLWATIAVVGFCSDIRRTLPG